MIDISNISKDVPYRIFSQYYQKALNEGQQTIEAISISTFNKNKDEVTSRFVNLKYVIDDEWIFFSNYNSDKANDISSHNQISASFYWHSINTQIRIKANIFKSSEIFSDKHFLSRSKEKNALAISSNQSSSIDSYSSIIKNYESTLQHDSLIRPEYWGGYSFTPYYFEFWEGHDSRLNKRNAYELNNSQWLHKVLQP
jgi:pyridoxamine 5'-phosphate oxidase